MLHRFISGFLQEPHCGLARLKLLCSWGPGSLQMSDRSSDDFLASRGLSEPDMRVGASFVDAQEMRVRFILRSEATPAIWPRLSCKCGHLTLWFFGDSKNMVNIEFYRGITVEK